MIGNLIFKVRNRHFFVLDIVAFTVTPILSIFLRTGDITSFSIYGEEILLIVPVYLILKIIVLYSLGLYSRLWRYASIDEVVKISLSGVLIIFLEYLITFKLFHNFLSTNIFIPRSIPIIDGMLTTLYISFSRLSIRILERIDQRFAVYEKVKKVLIIGAGEAGVIIAQEMQSNKSSGLLPIGFVDDDPHKQNMRIRGINILGTISNIREIIKSNNPDLIVLAIPSAKGTRIRAIFESLKDINIEILTMPSLFELVDGRISIDKLRKIKIEDLLRRDQIKTDLTGVDLIIKAKNVLITGAGGSIGSEIVRQVSRLSPAEIILLGHGENSIFDIEQEFKDLSLSKDYAGRKLPNIIPIICDIKDFHFLDSVFSQYKPHVVFHAAAHKHVPLMEANTFEAIKNNVYGTRNLVELSSKYNVMKFILISSDKAVNPTNVMGATKRIAELLMLNESKNSRTSFCAVRFGNVLGSRGSVAHIFQKQIKAGGPITITHPDIMRYFMTIPEAVTLVLESCSISENGEIFVLDMGQPIKIIDLAKDMIRLSGLKEGEDIEIKFTALRPGEKLFEELFVKGEQYEKTKHNKILIAQNASINIPTGLNDHLRNFDNILREFDERALLEHILKIVPEFVHKTNKAKSVEKENVFTN